MSLGNNPLPDKLVHHARGHGIHVGHVFPADPDTVQRRNRIQTLLSLSPGFLIFRDFLHAGGEIIFPTFTSMYAIRGLLIFALTHLLQLPVEIREHRKEGLGRGSLAHGYPSRRFRR